MVSSETSSQQYLYFGVGVLSLFILSGVVFLSAGFGNEKNDEMVTLSVKTPNNTYSAEIPEEQLFSKEPNTILFSSTENSAADQLMLCKINCINND